MIGKEESGNVALRHLSRKVAVEMLRSGNYQLHLNSRALCH